MTAKASTSQRAVISGAFQALKRAARNARELSRATGTPFYVLEDGKVVDLNRQQKKKRQLASAPR